MSLVADIRITGSLFPSAPRGYGQATADSLHDEALDGTRAESLLTVEQSAEILHVSRDRVYYLIRSGHLRSLKLGKLRRISPVWSAEFIEEAETGM